MTQLENAHTGNPPNRSPERRWQHDPRASHPDSPPALGVGDHPRRQGIGAPDRVWYAGRENWNMPGQRVPGHTLSGTSCLCGWTTEEHTKRGVRAAYAAHLAEGRAAHVIVCRDCGIERTPREMSRSKPSICKTCSTARTRAWAEANPDEWERHRRRSWLKQKYGITPERYDELLCAQGGVCAICGQPPTDPRGYRMHVDHCHDTGRVRGILCGPCNQGIGRLGDSVERLRAAIDYLQAS